MKNYCILLIWLIALSSLYARVALKVEWLSHMTFKSRTFLSVGNQLFPLHFIMFCFWSGKEKPWMLTKAIWRRGFRLDCKAAHFSGWHSLYVSISGYYSTDKLRYKISELSKMGAMHLGGDKLSRLSKITFIVVYKLWFRGKKRFCASLSSGGRDFKTHGQTSHLKFHK